MLYKMLVPGNRDFWLCKHSQTPPDIFASKQTSHYLAALELLSLYPSAPEKLLFAAEWILRNRKADGKWDMGTQAKDGIYFPLSDS